MGFVLNISNVQGLDNKHIEGVSFQSQKARSLISLIQKISTYVLAIFILIKTVFSYLIRAFSIQSKNSLGIVSNPGQGNCLFYSFSEGLKRRGFGMRSHQDLRYQAVMWLKNNLGNESIQMSLLGALMQYQESCIEEMTIQNEMLKLLVDGSVNKEEVFFANQTKLNFLEQLDLEKYLDLLAQDGFFADESAIVALGQIYQVPIRVESYYPSGKMKSIRNIEISESSRKPLILRYQGCHYEYQEKPCSSS